MSPALAPPARPLEQLLLRIDPQRGTWSSGHVRDLPTQLRAGDVLVVNDAATLPASLSGRDSRGQAIEVRLLEAPLDSRARAVAFGAGDWRTPTEHRPPPPRFARGDRLALGALSAEVEQVDPAQPRLLALRFEATGDALWSALYREGHAVQYSYLRAPLELWDVQTAYAARPWAVEMPSAGRPLTWELLLKLRQRGVQVAFLTHAAGLSSTGDAALDSALPLRERYEIPAETVAVVRAARAEGRRVVAVGTSVVRALEGSALGSGGLRAGAGETELHIGPGFRPQVVDGLYTGMHEPTASHFALLQAFAPAGLIRAAYGQAEAEGYQGHEFGDSNLILAD
jgi:S-adenosylmethionine:tRNA ribosyltransferase-isomerase